jgi:hypothetical protein
MKNAATVFMALIFVIGLVITIFSFKIAGTLVDCSTSSQNALRGLIVMGTALICIPITILAFNCQLKSTEKESMMGNVFVVLLLLINIAITGLASVIHNECEDSRTYTSILITLSVFGIISCFSYLGYEGYKKFGKGKEQVKKPTSVEMGSFSSPSPSSSGFSNFSGTPGSLPGG